MNYMGDVADCRMVCVLRQSARLSVCSLWRPPSLGCSIFNRPHGHSWRSGGYGFQWLDSNHLGENTHWSGPVIRSAAKPQALQDLLLPDADCHQKESD